MFLRRITQLLSLQLLQSTDNTETGVARLDHVINIAILSGVIRVRERFLVFRFLLGSASLRILSGSNLFREDDLNSAARAHDSDLSSRPSIVHITTQVLRAHHAICATIRLTQCYSYFRHSSLTVSVKQFSAMQDNTIVLLTCTRQETRNICRITPLYS